MTKKIKLAVYPTDTVYGIGALYSCRESHKALCEVKGQDEDKPISVMYTNFKKLWESFDFPNNVSTEWLKKFFSYKTTLAVPINWAKFDVPKHIHNESPLIAIRYLEDPILKEVELFLGGMFTTTSLNITGEPAIINTEEAKTFSKSIKEKVKFFASKKDLTEEPSSILILDEFGHFDFIRKGKHHAKVSKHVGLLST